MLAALSPLLCSVLGEADTWEDETVSVVMPDFSIQQVSRYLADIFTCEDLGQHPEINLVLGRCVEDIAPLVDTIDLKDECLTSLQTPSPVKTESFFSQNKAELLELGRKQDDNQSSGFVHQEKIETNIRKTTSKKRNLKTHIRRVHKEKNISMYTL